MSWIAIPNWFQREQGLLLETVFLYKHQRNQWFYLTPASFRLIFVLEPCVVWSCYSISLFRTGIQSCFDSSSCMISAPSWSWCPCGCWFRHLRFCFYICLSKWLNHGLILMAYLSYTLLLILQFFIIISFIYLSKWFLKNHT